MHNPLLPHSRCIPSPPPPWPDNSNYTLWTVQNMKLLIVQFSTPSWHFILLWSKYCPQHPVPKHPQSNVYTFWQQKVLHWMVSSITRIQSPFNYDWKQLWLVTVIPKYLNSDTCSDILFARYMSQFWPAFSWQDTNIYLVFCTFTSRPTS
jgi:hypothetical protein